jgi:hypothetical protein
MLKNRIISTLKFFDLQNYPLTLLELGRFLIADPALLKSAIDENWELINTANDVQAVASLNEILNCLENECRGLIETQKGFYCLAGRQEIINLRWRGFLQGIKRERLIKKYISGLCHLPFVRGVALGGSQAMGLNKPQSDIDLLIITEANFMWLARTFVTVYFQISGHRRHGKKIANRFCLNHYLSMPKAVGREKNLYKAMEYGRLRPLVYPQALEEFQTNNAAWIENFFPNWHVLNQSRQKASGLQKILEPIFKNSFGRWLERRLQSWQIARIKQGEFIFVTTEELSFHPESKHENLLRNFFA